MESGAHMYMAPMPPASAADMQAYMADLATAKAGLAQYADVTLAEQDGYEPPAHVFPPTKAHPQQCDHFTNHRNAVQENLPNAPFDPGKPASLLYVRSLGSSAYQLVGLMWMAPQSWTEAQINDRLPLSLQQWHEHINLCNAPAGANVPLVGPNAEFGLAGSISTPDACAAAGGTFQPHLYGWMAHAFPFGG